LAYIHKYDMMWVLFEMKWCLWWWQIAP